MPKYFVYVNVVESYLVEAEDGIKASEIVLTGEAGEPFEIQDTGLVEVYEDERNIQ
jgi:hypothetical protein